MGKLAHMARTDPNSDVRATAAWAIGRMDLKMRKLLLKSIIANDKSQKVKNEASKSLAMLEKLYPNKSATEQNNKSATGPCMKDSDCKGNRICMAPPKYSDGWAKEAGIYGVIATGISAALSFSSMSRRKDMTVAIPLAASATVVNVISAAIIAAGAKSAKSNADVTGSMTFRLIGWLSFAFHITGSFALASSIPLHWVKEDASGDGWVPPTSWLAANTVLGIVSVFSLSLDAFVADRQADKFTSAKKNKKNAQTAFSGSPFISPVTGGNNKAGVIAGYSANF
jgi:hypothetical protein